MKDEFFIRNVKKTSKIYLQGNEVSNKIIEPWSYRSTLKNSI